MTHQPSKSITNFVEVDKTVDEEIDEIIDSLVADVYFEKTWPSHTAYYQINLNQFKEKLRSAFIAKDREHEQEMKELEKKNYPSS